jgi:hypothetical protein
MKMGMPAAAAAVRSFSESPTWVDSPRSIPCTAAIVLVAEEAPRGVLGLLTLSSRPALRLQGWVGAVDELVVGDLLGW